MKIWIFVAICTFGAALSSAQTLPASSQPADSRFGPFKLFDDRSLYGTGFYPEPFLVDEGDLDRELEFSWLHEEGHGTVTDVETGEVEWSFGETTIELEVPWERDTFPAIDPHTGKEVTDRTEGMDGIQTTIRNPIWQFVSSDEKVDNTVVIACEVAAPTNSQVGKDTEVVPEIFDLLRLGDHFGLQTHVGYSTLLGPDPANKQTLEYSADFSYQLTASDIPLPKGLIAVVPMFELAGTRGLNEGDLSDNLSCVIGGRLNFANIGPALPRLGFGVVLPVDRQAEQSYSWGFVTSLVFDL